VGASSSDIRCSCAYSTAIGSALEKMAFLIDVTEARFKTPANQAVIDFIRRVNPFAHSDLGLKLIELARDISEARYYCPAFSSCAYVVLHTDTNVIFAIAFGMRNIGFRLPAGVVRSAVAEGRAQPSEIGEEWLSVNPFPAGRPTTESEFQLRSLCGSAFRYCVTGRSL
jgi:hypothetical protein